LDVYDRLGLFQAAFEVADIPFQFEDAARLVDAILPARLL
jgi:hypothetical protein